LVSNRSLDDTPVAEVTSAPWWAALEACGLDHLSAPELAHALRELAQDRPAFVGLLAAANDYPRVPLWGVRRPDAAELARLDQHLPRSRAVLAPEDEVGVQAALDAFDVLLVLDPLWHTQDLLYASWHARDGIPAAYAHRLHQHLAPAVRLSSAGEKVRYIPDHLPGSWDPFPVRHSSPLRRAASLVYWANRLRAVAVSGQSDVAICVSDLAQAGPDLQGGGRPDVSVQPGPRPRADWATVYDALGDDPTPLASLLGELSPAGAWRLGLGARALPDVSLALLRAAAGRPIRSGLPGAASPLARRPVYLVPG
jgi:hypothetical protein